jgi:hypothetical protein
VSDCERCADEVLESVRTWLHTGHATLAGCRPTPLAWTKTPPSEPGWYWFHDGVISPGIVEVRGGRGGLRVDWGSLGETSSSVEEASTRGAEWAGPISMPVFP